ncbi:uncharacterized protein LOC132713701 [Ruditapes philippinarum]|uniref:uncharacterized protein LOC132713701 n=1 Tax=Ruditapes philippinarum TaxID=129788 RepID=UPI00295A89B4|nr:uncharacterized protein LOC132713701 [Ruditapes philippinarum]
MLITTYFYTLLTVILFLFSNEYRVFNCAVQTVTFSRDLGLSDKICVGTEKYSEASARSKVYCSRLCHEQSTCTSIFYSTITGMCTLCSGYDNLQDQTGTLFYIKQSDLELEGKVFRIYVKENNRFWHYDGNNVGFEVVSCRWQPDDDFTRFTFEKQGDGSYRIKSFRDPVYMYDGSNSADVSLQPLSGVSNIDDDHGRFVITRETLDYYRIQTKSTGRFVRVDEGIEQYVTTLSNIQDDRSLFKFIEE